MKKLLFALALAILPAQAHAVSRLNPTSVPCAKVQAFVRSQGAVILRWQSARVPGLPLFGRYVSDGRFCSDQEYAKLTVVPASDTRQCRVKVCERLMSVDEDFFRRRH